MAGFTYQSKQMLKDKEVYGSNNMPRSDFEWIEKLGWLGARPNLSTRSEWGQLGWHVVQGQQFSFPPIAKSVCHDCMLPHCYHIIIRSESLCGGSKCPSGGGFMARGTDKRNRWRLKAVMPPQTSRVFSHSKVKYWTGKTVEQWLDYKNPISPSKRSHSRK